MIGTTLVIATLQKKSFFNNSFNNQDSSAYFFLPKKPLSCDYYVFLLLRPSKTVCQGQRGSNVGFTLTKILVMLGVR